MQKPNVIIIMTDDQGYGDLSCMGATDFKTPHIDSMANDGIRFTSMYSASSVCSPSRASLLTGRYPDNAGVRAILAELERQGILDNTIIYFQSDNGPSRESRNWLDGTEDPYYGGTAGIFTGHKFSLFEGGIRIPAVISWKNHIESGKIIDSAHIATDIFPTILEACGGNAEEYELDGKSILSELLGGEEQTHEYLFWELEDQTAVRYGKYKLVLNGRLVEGEEKRAEVFLSDLEADPGEQNNLAESMPELCEKLKKAALDWRQSIEENWDKNFAKNYSLT